MKLKLITLTLWFFTIGQANAQLNLKYKTLLDQKFNDRAELLRLKGVAAAVVFPDGSVWSGAYGNYGEESLTTDVLFEIGSNTKTMVAATILLLEEDNKLSLSDTLYKYLTPLDNISYGITVEQLLNHTSGLYNYTNHPDFGAYVNSNWGSTVTPEEVLRRFVDAPEAKPGEGWAYSNTNYVLLGQLIEKIEGKPLNEVFRERLYIPLGLEDTYFAFYDSYTDIYPGTWLSNGTYLAEPGKAFMTAAWAAGAVISTPEDLAIWAHKLYGGDLLSPSSYQKMNTTIPLGTDISYGLGMFRDVYKGKEYLGHGGTTLQNSEMQYSTERDFSVATIVIEQGKANQANIIQNHLIDVVEREIWLLSTPNETAKKFDFSLYPNPARGQMTISTNSPNSQLLSIQNAVGEEVYTEFIQQITSLDVRQLSKGYYFAILTDEVSGLRVIKKFVLM